MQRQESAPDMELRSGNVKPGKENTGEPVPSEVSEEASAATLVENITFIPTHQLTTALPAKNSAGETCELVKTTQVAMVWQKNDIIKVVDAEGYECFGVEDETIISLDQVIFQPTHMTTREASATDFAGEDTKIPAKTPVQAVKQPEGPIEITCAIGNVATVSAKYLAKIEPDAGSTPPPDSASSINYKLSTPSRDFRASQKQIQEITDKMQRLAAVTERTKKSVDNQNYKFDAVTGMLENQIYGTHSQRPAPHTPMHDPHSRGIYETGQSAAFPDHTTSFKPTNDTFDQSAKNKKTAAERSFQYK